MVKGYDAMKIILGELGRDKGVENIYMFFDMNIMTSTNLSSKILRKKFLGQPHVYEIKLPPPAKQ